jgi:Mg2+-importing ATPase
MLIATAIGGLAVALALPFTTFAATLGFGLPGLGAMGAILVLILGYLASAEMLKRFALRPLATVSRDTAKRASADPRRRPAT